MKYYAIKDVDQAIIALFRRDEETTVEESYDKDSHQWYDTGSWLAGKLVDGDVGFVRVSKTAADHYVWSTK